MTFLSEVGSSSPKSRKGSFSSFPGMAIRNGDQRRCLTPKEFKLFFCCCSLKCLNASVEDLSSLSQDDVTCGCTTKPVASIVRRIHTALPSNVVIIMIVDWFLMDASSRNVLGIVLSAQSPSGRNFVVLHVSRQATGSCRVVVSFSRAFG